MNAMGSERTFHAAAVMMCRNAVPPKRPKSLQRETLRPISALSWASIESKQTGVADTITSAGSDRYRMKCIGCHSSSAARGTAPSRWRFFRTHAMFFPRVRMVCIPSASCVTSPGSRPKATFQY